MIVILHNSSWRCCEKKVRFLVVFRNDFGIIAAVRGAVLVGGQHLPTRAAPVTSVSATCRPGNAKPPPPCRGALLRIRGVNGRPRRRAAGWRFPTPGSWGVFHGCWRRYRQLAWPSQGTGKGLGFPSNPSREPPSLGGCFHARAGGARDDGEDAQ